MKKILFNIVVLLILALTAISVSAAPVIVSTIPDQIKDEDVAPWTLDLKIYEDGDANETDSQLNWKLVDGGSPTLTIDTDYFTASIISSDNVLKIEPKAEQYGTEILTLRLRSTVSGTYVQQDIDVTLTSVDDPAVWSHLNRKTIDEDSVDGTTVFPSITSECSDVDSPITITAETNSHFTLYMLGDDLAIKDLEADYNQDYERVKVYCNGIESSFFFKIQQVKDGPSIVGTIPNQNKLINAAPWSLDLRPYESGKDGETDAELDWSVSDWSLTLFTKVEMDSTNNIVTFTPKEDASGTDVITLTLTGPTSPPDIQEISVSLVPEGVPVLVSNIPSQSWQQDTTHTLDLKTYFDPDTDMTYSVLTSPVNVGVSIDSNGIVTFTPNTGWTGTNTAKFRITTAEGTADSNDVTLTLTEEAVSEPSDVGLCDLGEIGNHLEITEIDIKDDDLKPGDTLEVSVDVENNDNDDMKVVVEATLYNKDNNKKIVSEKSESIKIKDDDKETFDIELKLDYDDEDIGEDDDYELRIKAYKSGDENEECVEDATETVSITREDDDVIIENYYVSSTSLRAGATTTITVDILNIGLEDQNDVYFKVRESVLGIDETSTKVDLEAYDDNDNSATLSKVIALPVDAKVGSYQLEIILYFNDGRDTQTNFESVTVLSGSITEATSETSPTLTIETPTGSVVAQQESKTTQYTPIVREIDYVDVLLVAGIVILVLLVGLFVKVLFFPKKP